MTEKKKKEVEWSFSFENIGESIGNMLESLGVSGDSEVKSSSFSEVINSAASAKVKLNLTLGEATVMPLVGSDNLIEADVTYVGAVELDVKTSGKTKTVKLHQPQKGDVVLKPLKDFLSAVSTDEDLHWAVRLSPDVPMDLEINTGMTSNSLELSQLQLRSLQLKTGTGKTVLDLPAMAERYQAKIGAGTGSLHLTLPDSTDAELNVSNGTGETNITLGADVALDAKVTGGLGACNIFMPGDAAVRLKATTGIGSVEVPDHFVRLKGGDDFIATSGTWETSGFETASRQITINYSGGVGKLTLKSTGPVLVFSDRCYPYKQIRGEYASPLTDILELTIGIIRLRRQLFALVHRLGCFQPRLRRYLPS
jgi:hypothetical protein